ncbi:metacaspase-2 [Amyelois transitella]|uniref:metacaspase-2 n=1 Tax=Amyelois transitella TaxID=680683 RepID=UPI0029903289|nr:metacaspase-2 [Amyelois transitella]
MCCKLSYFMLALFLDAVVSSPHAVPRYRAPEDLGKGGSNILKINGEAYLPLSQPSYMSPIPTEKDRDKNEEIFRSSGIISRNDNNLHQNILNNNKIESKINKQLKRNIQAKNDIKNANGIQNNTVIFRRRFIIPTLNRNENEEINHLHRQNLPVANNFDRNVNALVNQRKIHNENSAPGVVSYESFNNEPFKIQHSPHDRIAFQAPILTSLPNLESYHPATTVTDLNKIQVNVAHHTSLPSNNKMSDTDIQKIIADQRIQNVLSTINHIKRYLVIYPNGTVEHVDSLEPIAAQHSNFVLVNSGHFERNNEKSDAKTERNKHQTTAEPQPKEVSDSSQVKMTKSLAYAEITPSVVAITPPSSQVTISSSAVSTNNLSSAKTTPNLVEKNVEIIGVKETKELKDNSRNNGDVSEYNTTTFESGILRNKLKIKDIYKRKIPKNSDSSGVIFTKSSTKNDGEVLEVSTQKNTVQKQLPKASVVTNAIPLVQSTSIPDIVVQSSSTTATNNISSSTATISNIVLQNVEPTENHETERIRDTKEESEYISEGTSIPENGTNNDKSIDKEKSASTEQTKLFLSKPDIVRNTQEETTLNATVSSSTQEIDPLSEPTSATEEEVIAENASSFTSEHNFQDNSDSNQTTENTDAAHEHKGNDPVRTAKPMWFNASDPEFWQKVTDDRDASSIFLFIVKPAPRIEKDIQRTVYPDGSVFEELTVTVWEEEGAEPKVTKSSKLIHPDSITW